MSGPVQFVSPKYVDVGMEVIAPLLRDDGKRVGVRCVVTVARGYHAVVECKERGYRELHHIDDLRVPPDHEAAR